MNSLLFPLSFTKFQCKKRIERTFFSSVSTQKRWETAGSGATLPQYLPNPKNKFPVKFIFTYSVFVLLSTGKKTKTISLKVFTIIAFENWQKETKKGTLRSFNFKNLMLCLVVEHGKGELMRFDFCRLDAKIKIYGTGCFLLQKGLKIAPLGGAKKAPSSKNKTNIFFILTSFLKACVCYFLINFYFFTKW